MIKKQLIGLLEPAKVVKTINWILILILCKDTAFCLDYVSVHFLTDIYINRVTQAELKAKHTCVLCAV